ncbi:hypothetical protein [Ornithinibacillus gellani]|uniref:hypothetical protein n=1 Tax=Ornithinibacillus gellani TaxID=2293253 RepID=UPI001680C990|nr:hypothetical protein [Ornithinibacillus gellani]
MNGNTLLIISILVIGIALTFAIVYIGTQMKELIMYLRIVTEQMNFIWMLK